MWKRKDKDLMKDDKLVVSSSTKSKQLVSTAASSSSSSTLDETSAKRKAINDSESSEYLRRKHKFIRTTIRTDYQPDICKDYKTTGFCGFGDSCKFLHDRSDDLQGYQLDQKWSKGEYKDEEDSKYLIKDYDEAEAERDDLTKCVICREEYKDPIVTQCKHYFCQDCAEKECEIKCFTCEKPTSGIFKNASKILKDKKLKNDNK